MKSLVTTLFTFLLVCTAIAEGEILVLEGNYQSKNLYVSNCYGPDGIGFAVSSVRVNGKITSDAVSSSAFEVDLSQMGLTQGDPVTVQIEYSGQCVPKVLNPGALQPMPTFEIQDMTIGEDGLLTWKTINESGKLPYIVEQFKWNKWVKVGEVEGSGAASESSYSFKTSLVSGSNKFRVKQKNLSGTEKVGRPVEVTTNKKQPEHSYNKSSDRIEFSEKTAYEVYDMYGQIRKRGYSEYIDFSNLESGSYYVNFDNTMEKFRKK